MFGIARPPANSAQLGISIPRPLARIYRRWRKWWSKHGGGRGKMRAERRAIKFEPYWRASPAIPARYCRSCYCRGRAWPERGAHTDTEKISRTRCPAEENSRRTERAEGSGSARKKASRAPKELELGRAGLGEKREYTADSWCSRTALGATCFYCGDVARSLRLTRVVLFPVINVKILLPSNRDGTAPAPSRERNPPRDVN